jgi:hypothetical protein
MHEIFCDEFSLVTCKTFVVLLCDITADYILFSVVSFLTSNI